MAWFEKRHLGDVVSRFGAVTTIQRTITSSFVEAVIDGLMATAFIISRPVPFFEIGPTEPTSRSASPKY